MNPNFLRPSTDKIDADKDLIMFKPTEIIGEKDLYTTLHGYELESEKKLSKHFTRKSTTILDESLGTILGKTFNMIDMSGDEYMKKYYKAVETLKVDETSKPSKLMSHIMAMAMYIIDEDNCIYLGILFVFISVIIYFMSIVS